MKRKALMALGVAAALGMSSTAFAGPGKHASSFEVMTPSSVNESAPWLAGQPHLGSWQSETAQVGRIDYSFESADGIGVTASLSDGEAEAIGASSSEGGSGSGGFSSGELSAGEEGVSDPKM